MLARARSSALAYAGGPLTHGLSEGSKDLVWSLPPLLRTRIERAEEATIALPSGDSCILFTQRRRPTRVPPADTARIRIRATLHPDYPYAAFSDRIHAVRSRFRPLGPDESGRYKPW